MFNIQLPQIEKTDSGDNYAAYRIEPLEPGWGHTLGASLRRILLSSLMGAAVTAVRVEPLPEDIPGAVQEDLLDIILNIKQLRVKAEGEALREGQRVRLRTTNGASEDHVVTAAALDLPEGIEVLNPEQEILTLGDGADDFEVEVLLEQGRGYVPADQRDDLPLDMIPIDAIYTPVPRVTYVIEHTRVGQMTDFDRLLLEIWTNGTIEADEALSQAARILTRYATSIASFGQDTGEIIIEPQAAPNPAQELANQPIDELNLTLRTVNALKRAQIYTIGQVINATDSELLALRNFGQKSLDELRQALEARGLTRVSDEEAADEEE